MLPILYSPDIQTGPLSKGGRFFLICLLVDWGIRLRYL